MKRVKKAGVALLVLLPSGPSWSACNANVTITKPDSIYTNHGNGTVTDTQTGLMWLQCSQGLSGESCAASTPTIYTWKEAMDAAQTANSGAGTLGHTDWRLPNKNELESLVEIACYLPSINTILFPATGNGHYWSSSLYSYDNYGAWIVNFNYGVVGSSVKNNSGHVRLVRGGQ